MDAYARWFHGGPEVAILRMLGLFDRPATEGEIAALREPPLIPGLTDALAGLGEQQWNKAVSRLRRVGLLAEAAAPGQDGGLDAHPLVREHFGEQFRQEQPEAWREGHQRLYEHLCRKAKLLPETIEEMGPLYAAVVHGCRAGLFEEALGEVYWKRIQREENAFNSRQLGTIGCEVVMLSAFFDSPWDHLASGLTEQGRSYLMNELGFDLRALGRTSDAVRLERDYA